MYYCLIIARNTLALKVMVLAIKRNLRVVRTELYGNILQRIAVLVLLGVDYENSEYNPTVDTVRFSDKISIVYSARFYYVVPNFVVAICYVKVYRTIRNHNMAAAPSSQEGNSPHGGSQEAKITSFLTTVVVGFYFCWNMLQLAA